MVTSYAAGAVKEAKSAHGSEVKWYDIQESVFRRWANDEVKQRGMKIDDLKTDLQDGLVLINLLEVLSGKSIGRYNKHPRVINQKFENIQIALNFITDQKIKMVNIGAEDIYSGNMRIILGLIWTLILFFEINRDGNDDLLKWVQSKIPEYDIKGWTGKDWNDGRALCGLIDALRPGKCPGHRDLNQSDKYNNCNKGITIGEQEMGVDRLILPEEMAHPKVDKLALMTYIAQYRNLTDEPVCMAHMVNAYGPGLIEGVVDEPASFTVDMTRAGEGNLEVTVYGPKDPAKVSIVEISPGVVNVEYTPNVPGEYKIHVTFDGQHIPGSIFTVTVLEVMSVGGEGKIIVFYTTTSSSAKVKNDFYALQRLFESKKVHLREDFIPWCAVDLLTRDDREAIFKKAGTRTLPITIVDDHYIGTYDQIMALEEGGKLDAVINYTGHKNLLTAEQHMARLKVTGAGE